MTGEQERTFTQEEVNKIVGDARSKARDIATAEASVQRTKDEEEKGRANLAAKQEWEKLARTHEARVKELEPVAEMVKTYLTFIEGVLEDTIKKMGKGAKSAVAGLPEEMTAMGKLTWLNANTELFQESEGAGVGTPTRPKDTPSKKKKDGTEREFVARF